MMTIHLKRETEELIQREIQRGSCKSPEEYVERAVRLLHEEEELLAQDKDAIAAQIASGLAQLDRGESVPGDSSEITSIPAARISLARWSAASVADGRNAATLRFSFSIFAIPGRANGGDATHPRPPRTHLSLRHAVKRSAAGRRGAAGYG